MKTIPFLKVETIEDLLCRVPPGEQELSLFVGGIVDALASPENAGMVMDIGCVDR